jgi:hypothetical protein
MNRSQTVGSIRIRLTPAVVVANKMVAYLTKHPVM